VGECNNTYSKQNSKRAVFTALFFCDKILKNEKNYKKNSK